jgi:tRNA A-37 threonylcarbamoyl transferase component Bud32
MSMLRKKLGSFYLVEKIGTGGMSEVFLGVNPRTREKRAYKILRKRATTGTSDYARFLREVDIIRSLSHPGIIKILDNGVLDDCYFYSMEYMPGGSLARNLERGKITVPDAVRLFLRICDGMAHAHAQGVIHRDLKPSNVLLKDSGEPVVSDFGIAKALEVERDALTLSGEILGTIAYLAPEQRCDAKRVNQRADVYALGAILYEMLMGFPPLGKFPWPREIHTDFPESFQAILEKCLAVDPANRFEHAGFLQCDLEKCQNLPPGKKREGYPISAKNYSYLDDSSLPPKKTDRIEAWFCIMRTGTTRERLGAVREMVDKIEPAEVKALLKLYSEEGERVRWGLIRVLGELKIRSATPLILSDLKSPYHTECAIEALGKIGAEEAYNAILEYVMERPEIALISLMPLAHTGKRKAVSYLVRFLGNEMSVLRQAAVRALGSIEADESLQALKERLCVEHDDRVRLSLFQTVHSLESALLHDIDVTVQNSAMAVNEKSL